MFCVWEAVTTGVWFGQVPHETAKRCMPNADKILLNQTGTLEEAKIHPHKVQTRLFSSLFGTLWCVSLLLFCSLCVQFLELKFMFLQPRVLRGNCKKWESAKKLHSKWNSKSKTFILIPASNWRKNPSSLEPLMATISNFTYLAKGKRTEGAGKYSRAGSLASYTFGSCLPCFSVLIPENWGVLQILVGVSLGIYEAARSCEHTRDFLCL